MFDVYMENFKENDIQIDQCWNTRILSCALETADGHAIVASGSDLRILNSKLIFTNRAIDLYASYSEISNCFFYNCNEYAIELRGSYNSITGCSFLGNSYNAANTYDDIYVYNTGQGNNIISNNVFDGNGKTRYAINIAGSLAHDNIISGNQFTRQVTKAVSDFGTNTKISNNIGFVTENRGNAVGTGSQQAIAHGCDFAPSYNQVLLSERSTGGAAAYMSSPPDAKYIYVTATAGKDYTWAIKYNP
jgi:hypothetical protein